METVNHEYYVSLDVAKLLKQAGFDWECETHYHNGCLDSIYGENHDYNSERYEDGGYNEYYSAPTIETAQRWLREVKGYDIEIYVCHHYGISAENEKGYFHELVINNEDYEDDDISSQFSRTYEGAQEAGIKKALKLILEKGE